MHPGKETIVVVTGSLERDAAVEMMIDPKPPKCLVGFKAFDVETGEYPAVADNALQFVVKAITFANFACSHADLP